MQPILKTTEELEKYLLKLQDNKVIFLDTEFKRKDTYFPILCLIQISIAGETVLIDPSIKSCNLSPLIKILLDNNILKVLHSARQDLEIFYCYTKNKPIKPIFDTQIAASFCGFGSSISYEAIVLKILNVQLDKSQRITDWEKRPLSNNQIKYALNDVIYLPKIYEYLRDKLDLSGFRKCHDEEVAIYEEATNFLLQTDKLWRRISFESRDPKKIAKLVQLIEWRERVAVKTNLNRAQILTDEEIYLLVFKFSKNHLVDKLDTISRDEIIGILDQAPSQYYLSKADEIIKLKFRGNTKSSRNLIKLILKIRSEELNIPEMIIAKADELILLSQFDIKLELISDLKIMNGWRYELFGKYVKAFIDGMMVLRLENGKIKLV